MMKKLVLTFLLVSCPCLYMSGNNPPAQDADRRAYEEVVKKLERAGYDNKTRSFFYQWTPLRPFGFMSARLKHADVGGYSSIGFNKGCWDALTRFGMTYELPPEKPSFEFGVSLGISLPIVPKYIWALASPLGYVGGGYNQPYSSLVEYWRNIRYYNVYAPEAGLVLRLWHFVFSYKFQYKHVFTQEQSVKDMFGNQAHILSVGLCW